ncbi:MAG: DNA repair exonuclease [Prochlorococcaceae cyanobacterium]
MPLFLHSADWQIGKPYARIADPDKRARLRQARLEAIERIGDQARRCDAAFLVVAGDLFDSPTPASSDVSAVCSAIGQLEIPVLVIPGNHDHGAPGSVWHTPFFAKECQRRAANLSVLLERRPLELAEAVILPCPLLRRSDSSDPSGWLQQLNWLELPPQKARIVLAHGSIQGFGTAELDADDDNPAAANNRLDLQAPWLAEVDYVALGDWHGLKVVHEKAWYAGTPEPDRFARSSEYRAGQVLKVQAERGKLPEVEVCDTGAIGWRELRFHCRDDGDLERLEQQLDGLLGSRVGQDLLLLELSGNLSLAGQQQLEALLERLEAQLLRLKRRGHCRLSPGAEELAALAQRPGDPLIARVAEELRQRLHTTSSDHDPEVIERALRALHRSVNELGSC